MSKRLFRSFFSCMLAMIMIVSLTAIPSSAAAIKLNKTSVTLTKGYTTTLSVSGTSGKVTWSSADTSIAKVSSKGKVSGKGVGTTYIYAKTSGATLKCKVTVVAGKITVSKSNVNMSVGDKTTVRVKAVGTHKISVGSTNKSVVKASSNGGFSGDYINLTLTAVGEGTAKIKIYATNYSNVYKYINVTVEDDNVIIDDGPANNTNNNNSNTKPQVVVETNTAKIKVGETFSTRIYATSAITTASTDMSDTQKKIQIGLSSAASNGISTISIKGLTPGEVIVMVYLTSDRNVYEYIKVTVEQAAATVYTILDTKPDKTDGTEVITLDMGTTKKYMLVPKDNTFPDGYDIAKANDAVAAYVKSYSYYWIYTAAPTKKQSTDQIYTLNLSTPNSNVITNISSNPVYRYILIPKDYDEVRLNTAIAQYTGRFEYNKIYNVYPTKQYASDLVRKWTISVYNETTKKYDAITRYLLLPYNFDEKTAAEIEAKDKGTNQSVQEYVVVSEYPSQFDRTKYEVIFIPTDNSNVYKYMIVPKENCDFVKRNDIIAATTGKFHYYNVYSTKPTVPSNVEVWEALIPINGKSVKVYVIINPADKDQNTGNNENQVKNYNAALAGSNYNWTVVS